MMRPNSLIRSPASSNEAFALSRFFLPHRRSSRPALLSSSAEAKEAPIDGNIAESPRHPPDYGNHEEILTDMYAAPSNCDSVVFGWLAFFPTHLHANG